MAGFNYSALVSPGGLSEQLGHLAGVIAGANAQNRATDVSNRRADIDQAFREAQLQHYKNMEERQGLSGALNPLQQAAMQEHLSKSAYYDHLTKKEAATPKIPAGQVPFAVPGVAFPDPAHPSLPSAPAATGPAHPGIQYAGEGPDGSVPPPADASPAMIRHIQDTIVAPQVRDKLAHGTSAAEAVKLQRSLLDEALGPMGFSYDPTTSRYRSTPPPPHGDPSMGAPGVPPPGSGGPVEPEANPLFPSDATAPAGAQGGPGPDVPPAGGPSMPGNPGVAVVQPLGAADMHPTWKPGGGLAGAMAQGPTPAAPTAQPNGKVIPASALKAKAAQLYGGDINAAAAHAQSLGYTIDPSR